MIVVPAKDLLQTKKLIPDLSTWMQCFALYVAVLAPHQPERVGDLMVYMTIIAKASKKYKWPSWVVYDLNFRQEAASNPSQSWSKVDPSMYSQCFLGMARSPEGWYQQCQSLDHTTGNCPSQRSLPRKRPWQPSPRYQSLEPPASSRPVCILYNKYHGDCKFGMRCKFWHACSKCKGSHPAKHCSTQQLAEIKGSQQP